MIGAGFDGGEVERAPEPSRRSIRFSLVVAALIHLIVGFIWVVFDRRQEMVRTPLPGAPTLEATLVVSPEPAPPLSVSAPDVHKFQRTFSVASSKQFTTSLAAVLEQHGSRVSEEPYIPPSVDVADVGNVDPDYPEEAKHLGIEGTVELSVLVDERGVPLTVDIKRSSGFIVLDREALKRVALWHFKPALRGTQSVAGDVVVPLHFQLEKR